MKNKNIKKVKIITKVGLIKEVTFPIDEDTYKIWFNPTVSENDKLKYFADLYYAYVDDAHYSRNNISFSDLTKKQWKEINEKLIQTQDEEAEKEKQNEELRATIATLSEKQQFVINRSLAGVSEADIAKEMDITKQAVRSLKKRAVKQLRERLANK